MLLGILLVAIGLTSALQSSENSRKRYDGYKVLSVTPTNEEQLAMLHHLLHADTKLDFWQEPSQVDAEAQVMVSPEDLSRIEAIFNDAHISYQTYVDNVQDQLNPMWDEIDSRSQKAFDINQFNSLQDIYSWMDSLTASCRAGFSCEVYSIGDTYEGRPINAFKLSKSGANRKAYWIDATIHAREWIATSTALNILNNLVTGGDQNAIALTEAYDWYVLPVVNPDGYEYTWTNDRLWRKNRRVNSGSICRGVDLNRNFDFRWGNDGVSFNPCSDTFCGSAGNSEPETAALAAELTRLGPTLAAVVNLHSYSQYWLFPWGNTVNFAGQQCERVDDYDDQLAVANAAADAIQATYNTRWQRGSSCNVLYPMSGSTKDYAKGVIGIKYAFLPELRGNSFIIDASNIPLSFNEIWNGIVAMANAINA